MKFCWKFHGKVEKKHHSRAGMDQQRHKKLITWLHLFIIWVWVAKSKSLELKASNVLVERTWNNACLQVLGYDASCSCDMERQKFGASSRLEGGLMAIRTLWLANCPHLLDLSFFWSSCQMESTITTVSPLEFFHYRRSIYDLFCRRYSISSRCNIEMAFLECDQMGNNALYVVLWSFSTSTSAVH